MIEAWKLEGFQHEDEWKSLTRHAWKWCKKTSRKNQGCERFRALEQGLSDGEFLRTARQLKESYKIKLARVIDRFHRNWAKLCSCENAKPCLVPCFKDTKIAAFSEMDDPFTHRPDAAMTISAAALVLEVGLARSTCHLLPPKRWVHQSHHCKIGFQMISGSPRKQDPKEIPTKARRAVFKLRDFGQQKPADPSRKPGLSSHQGQPLLSLRRATPWLTEWLSEEWKTPSSVRVI